MNQHEHMKRIRARCVELLENGKKRTQGRWESDNWDTTIQTDDQIVAVATTSNRENDSPFIASCAGPAEAGWKATIAAIDLMFAMHGLAGIDIHALDATGAIIAAWPEELL